MKEKLEEYEQVIDEHVDNKSKMEQAVEQLKYAIKEK